MVKSGSSFVAVALAVLLFDMFIGAAVDIIGVRLCERAGGHYAGEATCLKTDFVIDYLGAEK